jgi:hypothetical protein
MNDVQQLKQIMQVLSIVQAMTDFLGKDDVEKYLRWSAKNYSERIFSNSRIEN